MGQEVFWPLGMQHEYEGQDACFAGAYILGGETHGELVNNKKESWVVISTVQKINREM